MGESSLNQIASKAKDNTTWLHKNWKYHDGDNMVWVAPAVDDSDWKIAKDTLLRPGKAQDDWEGIGWFRLHLEIDQALLEQSLTLIYTQIGAAEIYLDGKLIHQFGRVGTSKATEKTDFLIDGNLKFVPVSFDDQTEHVIAVRYSNFAALSYEWVNPPAIGFGLGLSRENLTDTLARNAALIRKVTSYQFFFVGAPLAFTLLHLLLFFFYPRARENLYYAVFTGSYAAVTFFAFEDDFATSPEAFLLFRSLFNISVILVSVFGARFLYAIFFPKLPKLFWFLTIGGVVLGLLSWYLPVTYIYLFAFVALAEMLRVILVAIFQKKDGAWIIGIGSAVFILTAANQMAADIYYGIPLFIEYIYVYGILAFLISMSVYLARQFAQTNITLEKQLIQVNEMSDQLRQLNAALEERVSQRTAELANANQALNAKNAQLAESYAQIQAAHAKLQETHEELRNAQAQLIQSEKMASLGALTAGIAHEIKNPLNFVNNFGELSTELLEELMEEIDNQKKRLDADTVEAIEEILGDLKQNTTKISEHGKRADSIVQGMLAHSRGKSGERQPTDINALLDEYVKLAYHGMRAKDGSFNVTIETDYDDSIDLIEVVPQDMSRAFLNVLNNGCYAAHQKQTEAGEGFTPRLWVRTKNLGEQIEIRIRDNGSGIPKDVVDKIFNPFFTTKPAGEGTGLGLSITYEIVVQEHKGEINVDTAVGKYTEFIATLPK